MIVLLLIFAVLAVPLNGRGGVDTGKLTFYVQLVRATDRSNAPVPGGRLIGPKLAERIQPVYRWREYWEIDRKMVSIQQGQKARVRLNPEREVEIDLSTPSKRKVTVFFQGRPMVVETQHAGTGMSIAGGDREGNGAWFIVVRKDKPAD
jgi:hypothetical protein